MIEEGKDCRMGQAAAPGKKAASVGGGEALTAAAAAIR